jgi:hypothetical protein
VVGCRDLSYDASFTSGNPDSTGVPHAGPSACERLTLGSPITGFQYTVGGTDCTCTLERRVNGQCTDGNAAAVCGGQSNTYTVQVTVENLYEDAILAYVQGGLASGKDVTYGPPVVTCGTAQVGKSSAGNVVTW